jgi:hypothetical protein
MHPDFRLLPCVGVSIMKASAVSRDGSVTVCKTGDHPNFVCPWSFFSQDPEMKETARQLPWSKESRNLSR